MVHLAETKFEGDQLTGCLVCLPRGANSIWALFTMRKRSGVFFSGCHFCLSRLEFASVTFTVTVRQLDLAGDLVELLVVTKHCTQSDQLATESLKELLVSSVQADLYRHAGHPNRPSGLPCPISSAMLTFFKKKDCFLWDIKTVHRALIRNNTT